jgi:hypothetical protein
MKILKYITNGVLLIIIGIMHTQFALSKEMFGKEFTEFSKSFYYKISNGTSDFPIKADCNIYETQAAFWFFYFGIFLIPLGLLVHSIEKGKKTLSHSFTISYLIFVLVGCYMIPSSGMTFFMLPQAIYMLIGNYLKARKTKLNSTQ